MGEAIAYNDRGEQVIVRQVHPETGQGRTVVLNEDGSQCVFGENTVSSLTDSVEEEANNWMDHLTDRQLRGLVHEMGQRLVENSRVYQGVRSQLERLSNQANFSYFGLGADATEKDLDLAYRKLAKKMHPDKNGGTDAAKMRFQDMKERYEALKSRYQEEAPARNPPPEEDEEAEKEPKADGDEDDDPEKPKRQKEAYDDDSEDERQRERCNGKDSKIEYDPHDRVSLNETVQKMLSQLKTMLRSMDSMKEDLRRNGLSFAA